MNNKLTTSIANFFNTHETATEIAPYAIAFVTSVPANTLITTKILIPIGERLTKNCKNPFVKTLASTIIPLSIDFASSYACGYYLPGFISKHMNNFIERNKTSDTDYEE